MNKLIKYDGEEVGKNFVNVYDYIDNKFYKLLDIITSYSTYNFNANLNEGLTEIRDDYTPIILDGIQNYGNSDIFKINHDNIEIIADIYDYNIAINFITNLVSSAFGTDENIWSRIRIVNQDGIDQAQGYNVITIQNSKPNLRISISNMLNGPIAKGYKIYFELSCDVTKSINVSKGHFTLSIQKPITNNLCKFKY